MAAPVTSAATFLAGGNGISYNSQLYGEWIQVHDNASETVQAGSVLLNPTTYSSVSIHPLTITMGTKLRLMAEMPVGTTLVTTSPTVRVFGADKFPNAAGVYPANTTFWRLDANTFTGTATTLTLALAATSQQDGVSVFSNPTSNDGWNLLGAKSVLVIPEVAASISGGANTTVQITAQVLNF